MQYNWTRSIRKEPSSILETVLRVALYQPANCNLSANVSCVQPRRLLRHRLTNRPMKFRCFTAQVFHACGRVLSSVENKMLRLKFLILPPVHFSMRLHLRCPESGTKSVCLAIVSSNAARVVRITNKVLLPFSHSISHLRFHFGTK